MLFENEDYIPSAEQPDVQGRHVFQDCNFLELDRLSYFEGSFLSCEFNKCLFYWSGFNLVLFYNCKFVDCTFAGVSFMGCRVVDCTFENCAFTESNTGGPCRYEETEWYGTKHINCQGWEAPKKTPARPNP